MKFKNSSANESVNSTKLDEFAKAFKKFTSKNVKINFKKRRTGDMEEIVANNTKLKKIQIDDTFPEYIRNNLENWRSKQTRSVKKIPR